MISIIVPVYNAGEYLRECIESVIRQSYKEFELLLVDDGSTDQSMEICKEYEQMDDRIIVLPGIHKGPYYARKAGVEKAKGDYVTFLDADDFIAEDAYVMAKKDMDLSIDVILFDIFRYYNEKNIRYDKCVLSEKIYDRQGIIDEISPVMIWDDSRNTSGIDPALWSKLFKADLIKKYYAMPQDIGFHYGEDTVVVYPVISNASSMSVHHRSYYFHRQKSKNDVPSYLKDRHYLDKLYELYKCLSESMTDDPRFQRQIDLFYVYSTQLVKRKYGITAYPQDAIFPFDQVEKGEQIVIYGAGNVGRLYVKQLEMLDYCQIVLWADMDYKQLGGEVHAPEEVQTKEYDKIVIAIANQTVKKQARAYLIDIGADEHKII